MNFYKLKNGNLSFEYDMNVHLERIEKLLSSRQDDFLSAILSAIIAQYFSDKYSLNAWYIVLLIIIFVATRFIINFIHVIGKRIVRANVDDTSKEKELLVQSIFWNKIVPKVIMGMSLVNRNDHNNVGINDNYQKELQTIYMYQARRCFWEASQDLRTYITSESEETFKNYVRLLKKEPLIWVFGMSEKYLEYIEKNTIVEDADLKLREYYKEKKTAIEKLKI